MNITALILPRPSSLTVPELLFIFKTVPPSDTAEMFTYLEHDVKKKVN